MTPDTLLAWPDPANVSIRKNIYWQGTLPRGPRVTTVNKMLGLGVEGLISWSGKVERAACLEACAEVCASDETPDSPGDFVAAVLERLGKARAHQKELTKASDIGTAVHRMIQWKLRTELGEDAGAEPPMSDPATVAFMSWSDWWVHSGLKAVRVEQPVWDEEHFYAGTVDLIAEGDSGLELWDWKSSTGVYETHHIQVAAYVHAANRWAPIAPGGIVRLPKSLDGDLKVSIHRLGEMYGGKRLTQEQLFRVFLNNLSSYNLLCGEAA